MGIPIGELGVAAARTLGGYGQGRLIGQQLAQTQAEKERQQQAEALRLSLLMRTATEGEDQRAALQNFLVTHGAPDLAGLPTGAATTLYGARQPGKPSASEDRLVAEALHRRQVEAARGEIRGFLARYGKVGRDPTTGQTKPWSPRDMFDFVRRKFPHLPDGDIWDLVYQETVPKKASAGPLDADALKAGIKESLGAP